MTKGNNLLRALLVASLSLGAVSLAPTAAGAAPPPASAWTIGPIIRGKNYSHFMPVSPTAGPRGAFHIDLPRAPGSAHYVTFPHGSLEGKSRIVLRYRIEAAPGVRIAPRNHPAEMRALITPYFQRRGDNWSGRGRFETYRWFATFASRTLAPGTFEIVAPLDARWTAIERSEAFGARAAFREAVADADEVGFVLGGGDGYGHGVYATGRARLVVTDFRVE